MPLGEAITQDFKLLSNNPTDPTSELDLPKSVNYDCCFTLPVLAETVVTSDYNNDKSSVIWFYDANYTAVTMELQKYVNGVWTKQTDLNSNANGTFYDFGFFTNELNEKAIGYLIDWQLVLTNYSEGTYRVKTTETGILGNTEKYSFEWCLKQHTPERANGTIRIDWWLSGITGDKNNDKKYRDFGSLDWFNEVRLVGWFGSDKSSYEKDYVRYQNGQQVWIQDERQREYSCQIGRVPSYVHEVLSGETFQADAISITDYNTDNANTHIDRYVKLSSDYEPLWSKFSKYAGVDISFINEYQNFVRKRC